MNNQLIYLLFILLTFFSCSKQQKQSDKIRINPEVVEAKGYVVPDDSLGKPKIVLAGTPKKILSVSPKAVQINTNIYTIGNPKPILAGKPKIYTPGQDTCLLPKIVPAISSPFLAGIPDVVIAKDPYIKDQNQHSLSSYGKLQGLKHSVIRCIFQDAIGNLWFATDGGGVSKFDGKYFTHFTQKDGLSNDAVLCILQDRSGNLWFGTYGGGVTKYDGKYFTHYNEQNGMLSNHVFCMLLDRNGSIWFGTLLGVCKYDEKLLPSGKASFTYYTNKEGLSRETIFSILQDQIGNIWFGTLGSGVVKYDGQSFAHYTEKEGLSNNRVLSIFQDKLGNLWFGTEGGGVSKYDGNRVESIERGEKSPFQDQQDLKKVNGKLVKTFTHFTEKEGLSNNCIHSISQDQSGNLWFGTDLGINKYDGYTLPARQASFTHITEEEGLINNRVLCSLKDKSGNFWFGTYGDGVSKYDGNTFTHFTEKEGLFNYKVRSIFQDSSNNLWFGSDNGVSKYDGKTFTHFTQNEGLSHNRVYCIIQDHGGNLWFGTDGGGVSKYDGKYFTNYTEKEGLSNNTVNCIFQDQSGNLWFGTNGGGVSKYDGKYFTNFTEKEGLSNNVVYSILQDRGQNLWFSTQGGVSKYDGKYFAHFTVKNGLLSSNVISMLQDQIGNLWFGTYDRGVTKYDGNRVEAIERGENIPLHDQQDLKKVDGKLVKTFTHFTEKEGLINNHVFSILQDQSGSILVGTRLGLSKLSQKNLKMSYPITREELTDSLGKRHSNLSVLFRNFTYSDGFLGIECNRNAIYQDRSGVIWIGSGDRLTAYHIQVNEIDTIPPSIQLIGIDLFNEPINWTQFEPQKDNAIVLKNGVALNGIEFDETTRWYGLPVGLSLKFNTNFLNFKFIGITQKQSNKVAYQYMLEGIDGNWSSSTFRNEASYGSLPHGTYTFKVKAMNSDGYWSNEYNYTFTIRPPWWKTWWFQTFMVTFIGFCLLGFYYLRLTALRNQKKHLELIVKEKTAEVVHQKDELLAINEELETTLYSLKEAQGQLVQSEKMASLGILTAGVAHEINNPLNYIMGAFEGLETIHSQKSYEEDNELISILLGSLNVGIERASKIVSGLNQFSRNIETLNEDCEIHSIIDNCLSMLYSIYKDRIVIDKQYFASNITIKGNVGNLHQVFLNIIGNAIDAIPADGTIHIKTIQTIQRVEILITDTGVGISPQNLKKVTDPFFTTKDPGKGTGLGLSITYNIISDHKGSLYFESELGKGTTVTISIPNNNSGKETIL